MRNSSLNPWLVRSIIRPHDRLALNLHHKKVTNRNICKYCLLQQLLGLGSVDPKSFLQQISDQLHELVDPMMINVVPLLMEIIEKSLEEGETIIFWNFVEKLGDLSGEIMLIDHFVEVPQTIE